MMQDYYKSVSPVFILGIARSGTTLLQSLLDGHPQLLTDVADSHFYQWYKHYFRWKDRIWSRSDTLEERIARAEAIMISHIFNEASPYYRDFLSGVTIPELKKNFREFARESNGSPKDMMESYFHALGLSSGTLDAETRFWVDKTLSYEYLFYRFHEWWPYAHFIYVVRDPRDVYGSYKKRDIRNERELTGIDVFALKWGDSVHALLDCERLIAPEKRYILRYEDLVQNPAHVMESVARFLGIDFLPCLLSPTKGFGRVPWGGNSADGEKHKRVVQDASNQWAHILSNQEVSAIEGLLHKEMQAVGYALSQPVQPHPVLLAKLRARRLFFQFLNLGL